MNLSSIVPKAPRVQVVLLNYRRPYNIPLIIDALRAQTERVEVVLIDAPSSDAESVIALRERVDLYVFLGQNFGAITRYGLAPLLSAPYTLFLDDDALPESGAVAFLLQAAARLHGRFSVLGPLGRRLKSGDSYNVDDTPEEGEVTEADFVVRGYFYPTPLLFHIDAAVCMWDWPGPVTEDDLVAQGALWCASRCPAFQVAAPPGARLLGRELSAPHALSARPDHLERRQATVQRLVEHGFVPLSRRSP